MTRIMLNAAATATGSIMSLMGRPRTGSSSGLGYDMDDRTLRDLGLTRFAINFGLL